MKQTICIFSALYAPHIGGVEKYTQNLAAELSQRGISVIVVTCNTDNAPARETQDNGVEILRLPCNPFMGGRYPLLRSTAEAKESWRWLAGRNIDGAIIQTRFYPLSMKAAAFAKKLGVPVIVIDHGSAHLTAGGGIMDLGIQWVEHACTNRTMANASSFYGVSSASCVWLKHFGISAKGVIPNAVDAEAFTANSSHRSFCAELDIEKPRSLVVAYTGRLAPEKGIPALLEAMQLIPADEPIHLLLAGDGALRAQAEEAAAKDDRIHVLGALPSSDIVSLLEEADVFCLPSRSEGFSTSLLEAAVCGCAPIITHVGGTDELISSEEHGFIISDASAKTVASALLRMNSDREACASMGRAIQDHAILNCTWSASAELALNALREAGMACPGKGDTW